MGAIKVPDPFNFSSTTGGSGLGLSIAYEIVQLHKGTIEIHSSASAGTEISVLLPRIS